MNHFRSNNNSLKYQRFPSSGCKDITIVKSEFVEKNSVSLGPIGSDVLTFFRYVQMHRETFKLSIDKENISILLVNSSTLSVKHKNPKTLKPKNWFNLIFQQLEGSRSNHTQYTLR